MQDPISDMLTRIRNGQTAKKISVSMDSSKMKTSMAKVLKEEGYVSDYIVSDDKAKPQLTIELKYHDGRPVIWKIARVSRPGLRVYRGYRELPTIMDGLGAAIISTPKGLMSDKRARKARVGGEVICELA